MKQILKILVLNLCGIVFFAVSLCSIVFFADTVSAQTLPGPPMVCGNKNKIIKLPQSYNETEFMVLQKDRTSGRPYFILYRNVKSGAWTLMVYGIPNAPSEITCVLNGGLSSYILPDLNAIKNMLKKQNDGLDEAKENNDSIS